MKEWFRTQYQNAFLWVPFIMAFGAATYFACTNTTCAITGLIAICAIAMGAVLRNKYILRAGGLFLFGMAYAAIYTNAIATPQIRNPLRNLEITGRVENIDYTPDKMRLFISVPAQQIRSKSSKNATIRLNIADDADIHIGDTINATANIFPPSSAMAPETFDYARFAYFSGLSATGFISDYKIIAQSDGGGFGAVRNYLHMRADSMLADALVLGYKNAIPREEHEIWTSAGIGHVWSISGFHMTLVSGWLFAIFFCIFRFIPYITRRIPARIPAMCFAWVGLLIYLMMSGMGVATVRAFLMITLAFAAFVIGRNALSMRNICIAFCIIFLINPYYVMQPGFQLSFSAIFGLIWFWNNRKCIKITRIGKLSYAIYATATTSVIATIFTAPFVIAHFYMMPTYGLIGNLVLLPVFSFAIMPAVIIGTITAPIGWHFPLHIADMIYAKTLVLATHISEIPYANIIMPHIPNAAIVMIIIGFLCLMFICGRVKYILCTACVLAGIITAMITPKPVFYSSHDNVLVAFSYDGKLEFNKSKSSGHMFAFDTWKQINGEPTGTPNKRRAGTQGVWIYNTPNFQLAYIQKFVPLAREIGALCRDDNIDYIVSYFDIRAPKCEHKILHGGFVIYPNGRVRQNTTPRPWNNQRQ